ncbi:hypothetical protein OGZ01_06220 [Vibrio harveyi]|nr:hypothetical protein [Vibrio harveyi]
MEHIGAPAWFYGTVVEAPAPPGAGNDIRSDSVWFSYATQSPEVVIEFERYDGSTHQIRQS